MSDIFIGCNPNEKQKHNLTFGEWVDSKLQKGEFDTPLLQKIAELQSALTTAQEENKRMREVLEGSKNILYHINHTYYLEIESALNGGKNE